MTVTFEIPEGLQQAVAPGRPSEEVARLALEALVADAVRSGAISGGYAAQVLGLSIDARERFLTEHGISQEPGDSKLAEQQRALLARQAEQDLAAVQEGIADFEAGRYDTFENVAARLRAKHAL